MPTQRDKELFLLAVAFADAAERELEREFDTLGQDDAEEKMGLIIDRLDEDGQNTNDLLLLPGNIGDIHDMVTQGKPIEVPNLLSKVFSGVDEMLTLDTDKYIQSESCLKGAEAIAKLVKAYFNDSATALKLVPNKDKTQENHSDFVQKGYPTLGSFFKPANA
ncbi:MAG: hypothetical protein H6867_04140 [Rhodospirillales bacterium]|nr:hypothetical protein [Rhodospirillales bacterium]MCB9996341.1 hypothetical protein [Rhodospirillales bacterium]